MPPVVTTAHCYREILTLAMPTQCPLSPPRYTRYVVARHLRYVQKTRQYRPRLLLAFFCVPCYTEAMPMLSNQHNVSHGYHFIFRENDILLQDGALPNKALAQRCIENQLASDWFTDTDYGYTALLLKKDAPIPADCEEIPLREYFARVRGVLLSTADSAPTSPDYVLLSSRARGLLNFRAQKRYCSLCGGRLQDDERFTARTCGQCGHQFFPQLEPAIIVLVSRGDEILLARHKHRIETIFTCIAGFVEMGETLEHAVAREVMEETGIGITNIRYLESQSWPYPDQLMFAFKADYAAGEIRVQQEELYEAHWFKRDSLPAIPKPGSIAHRMITGEFEECYIPIPGSI